MSPRLDTVLQQLGAVVGACMGALFALSGFGASEKPATLAANARTKNLLFVIGGASFFGLVDGLAKVSPEGHAKLFLTYMVYVAGSAVCCLAFFVAAIMVDARFGLGGRGVLRGRGIQLAMEFLSFGYVRYDARRRELEEADRRLADPRLLAQVGTAITAAIQEAAADAHDGANAHQRALRIQGALAAIETLTQLFAPPPDDLRLSSNYMVRIGRADLPGIDRVKFLPPDHGRYQDFLALRRYRSGERRDVFLAIEPADRLAALLPGAPTAFARHRADLINTKSVKLSKGVPAAIRRQVEQYFADEEYRSVLSLPMVFGSTVIGVINIESSRVDLVGPGANVIEHIERALSPLCLVLAEMVRREEGI